MKPSLNELKSSIEQALSHVHRLDDGPVRQCILEELTKAKKQAENIEKGIDAYVECCIYEHEAGEWL